MGGTADATTGLIQLGARAYDPAAGRFVSVDPKLNLADPQHLNGYAYGRNNPLAFPDPTGLYWGESWISPIGHGALDVAGLVPGFGEPADLLNGLWYTAEGNYIDAGLSYASAIPIAGYGASTAKGARYVDKAVDAVDAATDTVKAAEKTKDAVKNAENVTPPSTPKPKPPPKPAPPAKPKPAPPAKKADGPKKTEKADADKPARPKKDDDPDNVYIYKAPTREGPRRSRRRASSPRTTRAANTRTRTATPTSAWATRVWMSPRTTRGVVPMMGRLLRSRSPGPTSTSTSSSSSARTTASRAPKSEFPRRCSASSTLIR